MAKRGRPRIPELTPDLGDLEGKLPPKPIDYDALLHWMDLGATQEEIAGSFRVSVSTLQRRLIEKFSMNFDQLKETACGGAKVALRRNQFNLTKTNAAMGIWLGKQWLGQKENPHGEEEMAGEIKEYVEFIKWRAQKLVDEEKEQGESTP